MAGFFTTEATEETERTGRRKGRILSRMTMDRVDSARGEDETVRRSAMCFARAHHAVSVDFPRLNSPFSFGGNATVYPSNTPRFL